MRIQQLSAIEKEEMLNFEKFLLDIGNGTYPSKNDIIELPSKICSNSTNIDTFLDSVFPNLFQNHQNILDRAILTPLNDDVSIINNIMLSKFKGKSTIYLSADSIIDENNDQSANLYPTEFLNTIKTSGIPDHTLELKG